MNLNNRALAALGWLGLANGNFAQANSLPQAPAPSIPQFDFFPVENKSKANPVIASLFENAVNEEKATEILSTLLSFSQNVPEFDMETFQQGFITFVNEAGILEKIDESEETPERKTQLSLFIKSLGVLTPETETFLLTLHQKFKTQKGDKSEDFNKSFHEAINSFSRACDMTYEDRQARLKSISNPSLFHFMDDYSKNELDWFTPCVAISFKPTKDSQKIDQHICQTAYSLQLQTDELINIFFWREAALDLGASDEKKTDLIQKNNKALGSSILFVWDDETVYRYFEKELTKGREAFDQNPETEKDIAIAVNPIIQQALRKAARSIDQHKQPTPTQEPVDPTLAEPISIKPLPPHSLPAAPMIIRPEHIKKPNFASLTK